MGPWTTKVQEKGPQQLMHRYKLKDKTNNLRFFAEDVNSSAVKKYYLLTPEALLKLINYNRKNSFQNCFYEIMPSSMCKYCTEDKEACNQLIQTFGTRLYLDVEFPANADFTDYNVSQMEPLAVGYNIAKDLHTFVETYLKCKCQLLILKSHRTSKFSWHMIAKTIIEDKEYIFQDSLCVLTIINEWFDQVDLSKYNYYENSILKNAVDVGVYTTHRLYRTIYSSKFGKKIPLVFATYYPLPTENICPKFADTLCLQPLKSRILHKTKPTESSSKLKSHHSETKKRKINSGTLTSNNRKKHIDNNYNLAAKMFFLNWDVWDEMKKFAKVKWPTIQFEKASYKSIFCIYIPLDYDFRCPQNKGSNNGMHKNNHSCLWIKPNIGLIEWRCQDINCRKNNIYKKVSFPFELSNKLKRMYTHRFTVKITT